MRILIKERIKDEMKFNDINQVQLAKAIGMRQSNISEWLSGKKEPSINSLWLLADYFKVDIDYLVGRKNI